MRLPNSVIETMETFQAACSGNAKLAEMFTNCFPNTLLTTTELLEDGTTFVLTGDIPAMWLRDSSAQVRHYLPLAKQDAELQGILEGMLKRQLLYISMDPYANAFNKGPDNAGHSEDITERSPWVWERKYEIDSLCCPVQLAYLYWKATGKTSVFDEAFRNAVHIILELWTVEQDHPRRSPYRFVRTDCPETDTLKNDGLGTPVAYTGMTWSGFRPSDDACTYGYLIPANMFAVVVLRYIREIAELVYGDSEMAQSAVKLEKEIDEGIQTYGIVTHETYGRIYAYETDGLGNYNLMDDANVPSLLAIPYLGYTGWNDEIYRNTRRFILSRENPYYFEGKYAKGIGSPHTPSNHIWPISLIIQALTSTEAEEIRGILETLLATDAGTGFMHESFDKESPRDYTRPWFAWANSLFGGLIHQLYVQHSPILDRFMMQ